MSVTSEVKKYKNYGNCLFIDNGFLTVGVTVEVGPRVIYLSLNGKENIMFEDVSRRFKQSANEYGTWINYGGHRLWRSPELVPETYAPDNSPVDYKQNGTKFTFTAPATPFGNQFVIELDVSDSAAEINVTHRIKNVSKKPIDFALWSLSCMAAGGVCLVPISTRKSGFLPNRVLSLWDYSDINDPRFTLTNEYARIRQDTFCKGAFKAGFNVEEGFAAYAVKDQIFIKHFGDYEWVKYPDYSCNVEVYTNDSFLECELLGEQKTYAPGKEAVLTEKWQLCDNKGGHEPTMSKLRKLAGK